MQRSALLLASIVALFILILTFTNLPNIHNGQSTPALVYRDLIIAGLIAMGVGVITSLIVRLAVSFSRLQAIVFETAYIADTLSVQLDTQCGDYEEINRCN
jgi:hypothetical protein